MSGSNCLSTAVSDLGEILRCAICMCNVVDAVSLDCHHIFCNDCITAVVTCNAALRDSLECPVCRRRTQKRTVQPDRLVRDVASIINKLTAALQRACVLSANTPPCTPLPIFDHKSADDVNATPIKLRRGRSESRRSTSTSSAAVKSDEAAVAVAAAADDDTSTDGPVCAVCYERDDEELHVCDECGVCVHSECYGIDDDDDDAVSGDAQWRCDVCVAGERAPQCFACHNDADGAYKRTDEDEWMHVSCALWHDGPKFLDAVHRTPITNARDIDRDRFKIRCKFCRRSGACVQCTYGKCVYSYHVTCGLRNGIKFELRPGDGDDVFFHSFCPRHKPLRQFVKSDNSHVQRKRTRKTNASETKRSAKKRATADNTTRQFRPTRNYSSRPPSKDPFVFESSPSRESVILPTQLDDNELSRLHLLTEVTAATRVVSSWSSDVTHVVTPSAIEFGGRMERRTMKYLLGIAAGKPVLCIDWLDASLDSGCLLPVDDYLVRSDKVAENGAIKRFHQRKLLFSDMTCTLIGTFSKSSFQRDVKLIITTGGGEVVDFQGVIDEEVHLDYRSLVLLYENSSNDEWLHAISTLMTVYDDSHVVRAAMSTEQLFNCISHGEVDLSGTLDDNHLRARIQK